jgi:hypothetical protein
MNDNLIDPLNVVVFSYKVDIVYKVRFNGKKDPTIVLIAVALILINFQIVQYKLFFVEYFSL